MKELFVKPVEKPIKFAFTATFILGMLTHMYMFTNKIPNHDDVNQLYTGLEYLVSSGRWFLYFPASFSGLLSTAWTNGLFGMLYLALSACLITDVFKLKNRAPIVLMGATLVTFPSVCLTYTYMQCADAYFFSVLLMCGAVWLAHRYSFGFLAGAVLLMFSLAIYQAYFGLGLAIAVCLVIKKCLDTSENTFEILRHGIKLVAMFAVGMALYLVSVKVSLSITGAGMTSYQGLNTMGQIEISNIWPLLQKAYISGIDFYLADSFRFWRGLPEWFGTTVIAVNLVMMIAAIILKKLYRHPVTFVISVLCAAVLPFAAGVIYFMSNNNGVHALMIYGYIGYLIFPIYLVDLIGTHLLAREENAEHLKKGISSLCVKICAGLTAAVLCVTTIYGFVISNSIYGAIDIAYEQGYSFALRLVDRIEKTEGFAVGCNVYVVGYKNADLKARGTEWMSDYSYTGTNAIIPSIMFQRSNFLKYYMGLEANVQNYTYRSQLSAEMLDEIDKMEIYPHPSSIAMIDGIIVVKMNNIEQ